MTGYNGSIQWFSYIRASHGKPAQWFGSSCIVYTFLNIQCFQIPQFRYWKEDWKFWMVRISLWNEKDFWRNIYSCKGDNLMCSLTCALIGCASCKMVCLSGKLVFLIKVSSHNMLKCSLKCANTPVSAKPSLLAYAFYIKNRAS